MDARATPRIRFRLRVARGAGGAGRIDPLEAIAKSGSIAAAAGEPGISCRRARLLVDTARSNRAVARLVAVWQGPLFEGVGRRLPGYGCAAPGTVAGIDAGGD